MATLPVIRNSDNLVVNIIEAEPGFPVPDGHTLGAEGGGIGDTWNACLMMLQSSPSMP